MKTLATVVVSLLALNLTAAAFAENGSMRYREMVESLREQRDAKAPAKDWVAAVEGSGNAAVQRLGDGPRPMGLCSTRPAKANYAYR